MNGEYLSVEETLKEAKNQGVDFGNGDPYNRLRYYTKIGWIPHMTRMKQPDGSTKGHYPATTVDRLVHIQRLKDEGLTNDEISRRLTARDKAKGLYTALGSETLRNRFIIYASFVMIIIILAAELGIIQIGKPKSSQLIIQNANDISRSVIILDTGTAFVPKEENKLVVENDAVQENSKINVTFKDNYSPATKFWVSDIVPEKSFTVQLDAPTAEDAEFDWWITN